MAKHSHNNPGGIDKGRRGWFGGKESQERRQTQQVGENPKANMRRGLGILNRRNNIAQERSKKNK